MASLLEGLGGTVRGSFLQPPPFADLNKKPGTSPTPHGERTFGSVLLSYLTASFFFYTPNLIWFILTCGLWHVAPYPTVGEPVDDIFDLVSRRLLISVPFVVGYYCTWHVGLFWFNLCNRPFVEKRTYRWSKVLHNLFYTIIGAILWGLTESALIYCYCTGRLEYIDFENTSERPIYVCAHIYVGVLLVPIIRDLHIYFGHRFLHSKFLYKYIHYLHHRNTDVEPFAGMSMSPVEHVYYFSGYGPLLWLASRHHPFVMMFMGVHAALAPAGGHSGYEDHWQSDAFHYLHHRCFEVNYGSPGFPLLDVWFGSYRDRLDLSHTKTASADAKSTLVGRPDFILFNLFGFILPAAFLLYCLQVDTLSMSPRPLAFLIASCPILVAAILHGISFLSGTKRVSLWKHYMAPFDKDSYFSLLLHSFVGGGICAVLPLYHLILMLFEEAPTRE